MLNILTKLKPYIIAGIKGENNPVLRAENGIYTMTITARESATIDEAVALLGIPCDAEIKQKGEAFVGRCEWPSVADYIFGADGVMASKFDNYEMRVGQLQSARLFEWAIMGNNSGVVEAPTGTGKSLTYLMVAVAMGKRVVVSTSNKTLQAQLYQKDAPFVLEAVGEEGDYVALAQGKGNYVCVRDTFDAVGDLTVDVDDAQRAWLEDGDGDLQNAPVSFDWETTKKIAVGEHCTKHRCAVFDNCHYFQARAERFGARIVIVNHTLLVLDRLYPKAMILPPHDVLVIDEAHKLAESAYGQYGATFTFDGMKRDAMAVVKEAIDGTTARSLAAEIDTAVGLLAADFTDHTTTDSVDFGKSSLSHLVPLVDKMRRLANMIWTDGAEAETAEEGKLQGAAKTLRGMASKLKSFVDYDEDFVRFASLPEVGSLNGKAVFELQPIGVGRYIASIVNAKGAAPVVRPAFGVGEGEDDYEGEDDSEPGDEAEMPDAVLLTSATLCVSLEQKSDPFGSFRRSTGLRPSALALQVDSPFDYENRVALYVPDAMDDDVKEPTEPGFNAWCADEMRRLVKASRGGAFLLFTSNYNMTTAVNELREDFIRLGMPVFVQGELTKGETIRQFKRQNNSVLFATRSFFEGVDIPGAALRLVVLDKAPFAPSTPLTKAVQQRYLDFLKKLNPNAAESTLSYQTFKDYQVSPMAIDALQVFGRLMRVASDFGVVAILDVRLRRKGYGSAILNKVFGHVRKIRRHYDITEHFHQFGEGRVFESEKEDIAQAAFESNAVLEEEGLPF